MKISTLTLAALLAPAALAGCDTADVRDLNPVDILNTGLGPNSLNGIEVLRYPALAGFTTEPEVLMITNTLGEDDRNNDSPIDEDANAISSIDVVIPR